MKHDWKSLVKQVNEHNTTIAAMLRPSSIRIKLHGEEYWLLADSLDESGAIAPLEHCDENGNLQDFFAISYAHYYPDHGVMRYQEKIAERSDIEIIPTPKEKTT